MAKGKSLLHSFLSLRRMSDSAAVGCFAALSALRRF